MAQDIFGPASQNAVTVRPADSRTIAAIDTWFKNCSSAGAQDGTRIDAAFLNFMLGNMRAATRGMGVPDDAADDLLLLKAIQAALTGAVKAVDARAYLPLHAEVTSGSGLFSVSASTGQIVIGTGNTWVHRGVFGYDASLFSAGERTFATSASKTYHLRWYAPGTTEAPSNSYPRGRFMLRDVADTGSYNPGSLADGNVGLDGTYDSVLLAQIVTNGANLPTVTALLNKVIIKADILVTPTFTNLGGNGPTYTASPSVTWNYARKPAVIFAWGGSGLNDPTQDADRFITVVTATRYATALSLVHDNIESTTTLQGLAVA